MHIKNWAKSECMHYVVVLCYLAVTEKMYYTLDRKSIHDTYNQMH